MNIKTRKDTPLILVATILTLLCFSPATTLATSGGTDANNCHQSSQGFHCHGSGDGGSGGESADLSSGAIVGIVAGVAAFTGLIIWLTKSNSAVAMDEGYPKDFIAEAKELPFSVDLNHGIGLRW